MIQATSLSFNTSGPCNAHCPFCISRLTPKTGFSGCSRMVSALPRTLAFMKMHQIDTFLITGSGEPFHPATRDSVLVAAGAATQAGIPIIEIQTNGELLSPNMGFLGNSRISTIALSVADPDPVKSAKIMGLSEGFDYLKLASKLSENGFLVRVSLNLLQNPDRNARYAPPELDLPQYTSLLKDAGVHQLTLRELGIPAECLDHPAILNWIKDHKATDFQVRLLTSQVRTGKLLRKLSYGPEVYDYNGLSVVMATCMTDTTEPEGIRSIILQPDGHAYHSWSYKGSILF